MISQRTPKIAEKVHCLPLPVFSCRGSHQHRITMNVVGKAAKSYHPLRSGEADCCQRQEEGRHRLQPEYVLDPAPHPHPCPVYFLFSLRQGSMPAALALNLWPKPQAACKTFPLQHLARSHQVISVCISLFQAILAVERSKLHHVAPRLDALISLIFSTFRVRVHHDDEYFY